MPSCTTADKELNLKLNPCSQTKPIAVLTFLVYKLMPITLTQLLSSSSWLSLDGLDSLELFCWISPSVSVLAND